MAGEEEKENSVDDLKNKLYSRKEAPRVDPEIRTPLSRPYTGAPRQWEGEKEKDTKQPFLNTLLRPAGVNEKPGMPLPLKFFLGSIAFFLIAAGVAAFMFFIGGNNISPQNIDLSIVAPSVIDGGKATSLSVLIDNRNTAQLQTVNLIITYPQGTRDPNNPTQSLTHGEQSIGTINSGEQVTRDLNAIFYGQQGVPQTVQVALEYSVPGSNAIFEKDASAQFTVGSSPVSVTISAPQNVVANQQFDVDVNVQSNATNPVDNVVIQGQYPFGFSVVSSDPPASAGGTLWRLGTMVPGTSQTIHVVATLNGQNGDQRVLTFLAGSDPDTTDTTIPVPFLSVPTTLSVEQPFMGATIAINGTSGTNVSAPLGQAAQGTIAWQNNSTQTINNAQLSLSFSGPALNPGSISSSDGFFQSSNNTLTWSSSQDSALASIPPGGTGTLDFSFATLPPGAGGTVYSNPTVTLNLTVSGTQGGQNSTPQTVNSAATTVVNISSLVSLAATAIHFSGGNYTNTGPMPPVPGQQTQYTVTWSVKNSSNIIGNTTVSATLPPYVSFVAGDRGITYDAGSHTVTWSIGDLPAEVGYSSPAKSASFQVSMLPSTSQIGQSPSLTGAANLSGTDRFTQTAVSTSVPGPTTLLTADSGASAGQGVVAQ